MLWLAEAAIEGYFRDVLPAIPQVARGPFETHIREHFVWPDASRRNKRLKCRGLKPTKVAMDSIAASTP